MAQAQKKFFILNLGCKVNKVESDTCYLALTQAGLQASTADESDLIIINTCAVTSEAEAKTRKAVRKALKLAPNARVFVTGCAATLHPDVYRAMSSRIAVYPSRPQALKAALAYVQNNTQVDLEYTDDSLWSCGLRVGEHFPARMPLKVQDGCNNACTYCIVHVARGKSISRPLANCLHEAKLAFDAGVKELVLTGVDLGFYRYEDANLLILLQKLLECMPKENSPRIRLSSIEPLELDYGLADLIAQSQGRICAHLHLPLQSGCSKTLGEMGRPYRAEDFAEQVARIRDSLPEVSLTTDVIVGFPGETDEDFIESYDFCKQMAFSKIHVFKYSRREGTPAAARPDQVAPQMANYRSQLLRQLSDSLSMADAQKRVGNYEEVLVEAKTSLGFVGTSESYHRVLLPDGITSVGQLCPVQLVLNPQAISIIDEADSPILLEGVPWKPLL